MVYTDSMTHTCGTRLLTCRERTDMRYCAGCDAHFDLAGTRVSGREHPKFATTPMADAVTAMFKRDGRAGVALYREGLRRYPIVKPKRDVAALRAERATAWAARKVAVA